ncbi:MAG: hypothetical protein MN733_26490, partial [Nitrososphaera sp.]|nr:hypothetical protein [Nitrososphaera sp.]
FVSVVFLCVGTLWWLAIEPIKGAIADTMAKDVILLKFEHLVKGQTELRSELSDKTTASDFTRLVGVVERLNQSVKELDRRVTLKGVGR